MKKYFVVGVLFFFVTLFFIPVFVNGATECPTGTTPKAGVCFPSDTGLSSASVSDILKTVMNWLLGVLGFLGIIAFIISGMQYLLAAGDESTVETAKTNMKYSIIGIVVALSGYIIIQAVAAMLAATSANF